MRFVVCVKLTPDTEELNEMQPEAISSGDLGVTMVLNPWDEFAVEEALLLQERVDAETIAITVGNADAVEALKRSVAMGIEETMLVSDPVFEGSDAWGKAHILAQAIRRLGDFDLVLTGRQSVDGSSGLVPAGLAVMLGIPFVSQVAKIVEIVPGSATVRRAMEGAMQTVRVKLPAVISVSKEINEPRYPNFMGVRKASRLQYPPVPASQITGLDLTRVGAKAASVQWIDLRKPPARTGKCEFIQGAAADQAATLVEKLIAEKVI